MDAGIAGAAGAAGVRQVVLWCGSETNSGGVFLSPKLNKIFILFNYAYTRITSSSGISIAQPVQRRIAQRLAMQF